MQIQCSFKCTTSKLYQPSTIVSIPLKLLLIAYLAALTTQLHPCETSLVFYQHPKKRNKNLCGWSTMSLIGGGQNFRTSMSRSSQDYFCGKNSQKSIKSSQCDNAKGLTPECVSVHRKHVTTTRRCANTPEHVSGVYIHVEKICNNYCKKAWSEN